MFSNKALRMDPHVSRLVNPITVLLHLSILKMVNFEKLVMKQEFAHIAHL